MSTSPQRPMQYMPPTNKTIPAMLTGLMGVPNASADIRAAKMKA